MRREWSQARWRLPKARGKSKPWVANGSCVNNLRQIGLASLMYADDNEDALPGSSHANQSWVKALQPYAGGTNLWRCPRDPNLTRRYSYAINDFLLPPGSSDRESDFSKSIAVRSQSETVLMAECQESYFGSDHFHFADSDDGGYGPTEFAGQVAVRRHGGSANYVFVDGHVEQLRWSEIRALLTQPGSRFVRPDGHKP
jgi:prepilin-type processing-associated H-X9-DG protein